MNTARYIARRVPWVIAIWVALIVIANAYNDTVDYWDTWQADQIEREAVFNYTAIEYVATTDDGIIFASTADWYKPVTNIVWDDRLVCGGTWSDQTIRAADKQPGSVTAEEWPYKGAYPTDGRSCRMVSVISAEYRGRVFTQRFESPDFNPTQEKQP